MRKALTILVFFVAGLVGCARPCFRQALGDSRNYQPGSYSPATATVTVGPYTVTYIDKHERTPSRGVFLTRDVFEALLSDALYGEP